MSVYKATLCFMLVVPQFASAQGRQPKIAEDGETTISSVLGATKADAVFQMSSVRIRRDDEARSGPVQCTYSRFPCVLLKRLQIRINGKRIPMSPSAFVDLGDVSTAVWERDADGIALVIRGGDASESYMAKLEFRGDRLYQRRVFSGDGDPQLLEVTQYYQVVIGD